MLRHRDDWVQGWLEAHEDDDPPPTVEDAEEAYQAAREAWEEACAEARYEARRDGHE